MPETSQSSGARAVLAELLAGEGGLAGEGDAGAVGGVSGETVTAGAELLEAASGPRS